MTQQVATEAALRANEQREPSVALLLLRRVVQQTRLARGGRGDGEGVGLERVQAAEGGHADEDVVGGVPAAQDGAARELGGPGARRDGPVGREADGLAVGQDGQVGAEGGGLDAEAVDEAVDSEDEEGDADPDARAAVVDEEEDEGERLEEDVQGEEDFVAEGADGAQGGEVEEFVAEEG